ncbi:hypothetical protein ABZY58_11480 [Micromonospora tulbaghiae]|uniref:hypothetical protein n=1 Tax=Micromonospora tulbaghiae TaxID=479978 RepID=UPI0033B22AE6
MTRWSWRMNMPSRSRYEPPTPHVPTPAPDTTDPTAEASGPAARPGNRPDRFDPPAGDPS